VPSALTSAPNGVRGSASGLGWRDADCIGRQVQVGTRPTLSAMNNRKIIVPAGKRNQIPLQVRTQGGAAGLQSSSPQSKFKKYGFCRHDTIQRFT